MFSTAKFEDIAEIVVGMKTERFIKLKESIELKEHCDISEKICLSIVFTNSIKTIDLVAPNHIVREKWKRCLTNLIKMNKHKHFEQNFHRSVSAGFGTI